MTSYTKFNEAVVVFVLLQRFWLNERFENCIFDNLTRSFWTFTEILTFMDDFSPKRVSTDLSDQSVLIQMTSMIYLFAWQRM